MATRGGYRGRGRGRGVYRGGYDNSNYSGVNSHTTERETNPFSLGSELRKPLPS